MSPEIKLIVGLGNPGAQYADTRHNAGFWFVDRIAREYDVTLRLESKFNGALGKANVAGRSVWLQQPMTFMNLSGQAVAPLARFYKIEPQEILVAHDELDFDPGTVRLKQGGGAGGHNGLTDIAQRLGSKDFLRLRIGIGHPGSAAQVSSYVLKRPSQEDEASIRDAIDKALGQIGALVKGEAKEAMNTLHVRPKPLQREEDTTTPS
jgi:PTH1 family peptidyl-tRNA hydrolase